MTPDVTYERNPKLNKLVFETLELVLCPKCGCELAEFRFHEAAVSGTYSDGTYDYGDERSEDAGEQYSCPECEDVLAFCQQDADSIEAGNAEMECQPSEDALQLFDAMVADYTKSK